MILLESLNLYMDWKSNILMNVNDKIERDCGCVLLILVVLKLELFFLFCWLI